MFSALGTFNGFTAVRLNSRDQRWVHIKEDKDFEAIAHAVSH